jgi:hypothetical protein
MLDLKQKLIYSQNSFQQEKSYRGSTGRILRQKQGVLGRFDDELEIT